MQMPSLLPKNLEKYSDAVDEMELFTQLRDQLPNLINFFIAACDDQTWIDEHRTFTSKAIEALTRRFFRQSLHPETASKIAFAIRQKWKLLDELTCRDLTVFYRGKEYAINSLLFTADSPFLRNIVLSECVEKNKKFFKLIDPPFDEEFFKTYLAYIQEGELPDLWHKSSDELIAFMKMTVDCECKPLENLTAETYKRYLDKKNVFDKALFAYKCGWYSLFNVCAHTANTYQLGISFLLNKPGFAIEMHDLLDDTLKIFYSLTADISHLTCKGVLAENPLLVKLVESCPYLYSLDVADATEGTYILQALSPKTEILNITLSEWLNATTLAEAFSNAPNLTALTLARNIQLDYRSWGLFTKLKQLRLLNLSGCFQIRDADLSIILQGCPRLQELVLSECNKLLDQGFYLIGRFARNIINLDLSKCLLTDAALIDISFRCKSIQKLILFQCSYISDKGISEVAKKLPNLTLLNVKFSNLSKEVYQTLLNENPNLKVIA